MGLLRQWFALKQQTQLEYNEVCRNCSEGIYVVPDALDSSLWKGAVFTRKGPYSPALLRFSLAFPSDYPLSPPCITILTEVFHPLVAPLTTYTHTATAADRSGSTTSSARLNPGQVNVFYKFPQWGFRSLNSAESDIFQSEVGSELKSPPKNGASEGIMDSLSPSSPSSSSRRFGFVYQPPSPMNALDMKSDHAKPALSIVLQFVQRIFEDESILDELDLEDAANPSALHAWRAYRQRASALASKSLTPRSRNSILGQRKSTPNEARDAAAWNWDGVWVDRVRKTLQASIADSTLYSFGPDAMDPIQFSDLSEDDLQQILEPYLPKVK